jgi:hypothetical protein
MVYIYVLKLENNKYYVGKTNNPTFRVESHFNSDGSAWTKKYKPINIEELIPNCDDYDEDKYTVKYMEKYGITNVRGGSFCEIKLTGSNIITLKQMIKNTTDKCYICGLDGHYANQCKKPKTNKIPTINLNEKCDCPTSYFSPHRRSKCIINKIIVYFDDEDDDIDELIKEVIPRNDFHPNLCFRCGRGGHCESDCYAKTHVKGYILSDSEEEEEEDNRCFRCGREGHYANNCYAKTHIKGNKLG